MAIKREVSSVVDQALSLENLGYIAEVRGNWTAAEACYDEALAMCDAGSSPATAQEVSQSAQARIVGNGNSGDVLLEIGRLSQAEMRYRTALAVCVAYNIRYRLPEQVARFAWLAAARAQWARSARLIGAGERLYDNIDLTFETKLGGRRHARAIATTRAALGDAAFDAAHAEGWAMDVGGRRCLISPAAP
ncbi:MAG: hypothetical protein DYG90_15555 [Chloroflexi bacterium CFX6]|nr:hypothetical protein [Chloroflexi bacterium CFX6]